MRIFIGHDSRQPENTKACVASIERFGHKVEILDLEAIKATTGYERNEDGSTEFTYTRFLVPYLCNYEGIALFCDSDFIWLYDPAELLEYYSPVNAVSCVKHDRMPVRSKLKMEGKLNQPYPRKWWSSLMLFNCEHRYVKRLSVDYINRIDSATLHRFVWAGNSIGDLPVEYNYLVGYYDNDMIPRALHFTDGTPRFESYKNEPFAEKWYEFA